MFVLRIYFHVWKTHLWDDCSSFPAHQPSPVAVLNWDLASRDGIYRVLKPKSAAVLYSVSPQSQGGKDRAKMSWFALYTNFPGGCVGPVGPSRTSRPEPRYRRLCWLALGWVVLVLDRVWWVVDNLREEISPLTREVFFLGIVRFEKRGRLLGGGQYRCRVVGLEVVLWFWRVVEIGPRVVRLGCCWVPFFCVVCSRLGSCFLVVFLVEMLVNYFCSLGFWEGWFWFWGRWYDDGCFREIAETLHFLLRVLVSRLFV